MDILYIYIYFHQTINPLAIQVFIMRRQSFLSTWVISPIQHFYFSVYRFFYLRPILPSDSSQLSLIHHLPVDVIYLLTSSEFMSSADRACFVLTCKTFWSVLGGDTILQAIQRSPPSDENEREEESCRIPHSDWIFTEDRLEFLQRFQIYYPKRLLCYQCATFHRRPWFWTSGALPSKCDEKNIVLDIPKTSVHIPFSRAQEVMNYHRFGPNYGRPPSNLEFNTLNRYCCRPSTTQVRARIIKGDLVIQIDVSIVFSNDVDIDSRAIDRHTAVSALASDKINHGMPLPCMRLTSCKEDAYQLHRCIFCSAELRCIINSGYNLYPSFFKNSLGEARVTAWYNLGTCQSPFDSRWQQAVRKCPGPRGFGNGQLHPSESRYMKYFDGTSPQHLPFKVNNGLYGHT